MQQHPMGSVESILHHVTEGNLTAARAHYEGILSLSHSMVDLDLARRYLTG